MFDVAFLDQLRAYELDRVCKYFPRGARILEIGAGTGAQANELSKRGYDVAAIEIGASPYQATHFPVQPYDGRTQTEFPEPRIRINTDHFDSKTLNWNETTAWDELADYYTQLTAVR
jgi:hypothetical protein